MISVKELYARFLKDTEPKRLGALSSDLARLASLSSAIKLDVPALKNVLNETKLYSEWAALDAGLEMQEAILEIQRMMAKWQTDKIELHAAEIKDNALLWSDQILEASGLLD